MNTSNTQAHTLTQDDLNKTLWSAADSSRSSLSADVYKDYVLTMLFFKYLSDLSKQQRQIYSQRFADDVNSKERIEAKMKLDRFYIPQGASFDEVYLQIESDNLGSIINKAFHEIEDHNKQKIKGILTSFDFNSENTLGKIDQRNKLLRDLLGDFAKIDLTQVEGDLIGESYMYLIQKFGADAGKKAGEFFTMEAVARLLARLAQPKAGDRICDPACGSGGLLLMTGAQIEQDYNGSRNYALYGQESTGSTYQLARMNMFLHNQDAARIEWGDTLNNPQLVEEDHLLKFDICVANPPFWVNILGAENADTDRYKRYHRGVPPKDKGDFAFISHMIETAKTHTGRVAVIVPHGVLFRSGAEGKIRTKILQDNLIDAVIGLPAGLFQTTGIPVAILIIDRSREQGGANADRQDVLFIEASKEYLAGKAQNSLGQDNADKIYNTYANRQEIDKFSRLVTLQEIADNDYNLNITRYVDTYEEEEPIDISANLKELAELEPQIQALEQQMQTYLDKLQIK